jgi:hypothetical protein
MPGAESPVAAPPPVVARPPARTAAGGDPGAGPVRDASALAPAVPAGGDHAEPVPAVPPATGGTVAGDRFRSCYGGAFYLLALLDRLDLPAAAGGDSEPGPLLTRWGVLSLAMRGLGADPDDELFAALARLDGPAPGPDGRHPWSFRMPPQARGWFGPAAGPWAWWAAGDRLVVTDPAIGNGLVVADVPLGPDPAAQAEEESARAWPAGSPAGPAAQPGEPAVPGLPGAPPAPGPGRWGAALARLLTALLERAGLDHHVVEAPATIEAGALHVRVHLRVDDADLRVRRAGLDRDPGWVPALGRVVELVFG